MRNRIPNLLDPILLIHHGDIDRPIRHRLGQTVHLGKGAVKALGPCCPIRFHHRITQTVMETAQLLSFNRIEKCRNLHLFQNLRHLKGGLHSDGFIMLILPGMHVINAHPVHQHHRHGHLYPGQNAADGYDGAGSRTGEKHTLRRQLLQQLGRAL